MIEAVKFGHAAVTKICDGLSEWAQRSGKTSQTDTLRQAPEALKARITEDMTDDIKSMLTPDANGQRATAVGARFDELERVAVERYTSGPEEDAFSKVDTKLAFKKLCSATMRDLVRNTGVRCDGRATTQVRPIDVETGFLPRVHGSALFTRGETQSIATCTLGDSGMKQMIEGLEGSNAKRFYLQYTFPPSSVRAMRQPACTLTRRCGGVSQRSRQLTLYILYRRCTCDGRWAKSAASARLGGARSATAISLSAPSYRWFRARLTSRTRCDSRASSPRAVARVRWPRSAAAASP